MGFEPKTLNAHGTHAYPLSQLTARFTSVGAFKTDRLDTGSHPVGKELIDLKHAVSVEHVVPHRLNVRAISANCFYPGDCCIRSHSSGLVVLVMRSE